MRKTGKILFSFLLLTAVVLPSFADRGVSKRSRSKVAINIDTHFSLKNNLSGLKYNGSLSNPCSYLNCKEAGNLITYQKGNSIYIIHAKQKTVMLDADNSPEAIKVIVKSS